MDVIDPYVPRSQDEEEEPQNPDEDMEIEGDAEKVEGGEEDDVEERGDAA